MKSGIYQIKNKRTAMIYIGSSSKLDQREYKHFYDLRKNIHHSAHLQSAFNKYGKESFEFSILEECEEEMLIEREQYYLNTMLYAKEYCLTKGEDCRFFALGYNIDPIAGRSGGRPDSEEQKEVKRKRQTELWQQDWFRDQMKATKTPEWHQKKMSAMWTDAFREKMSAFQKEKRRKEKEADPEAYKQKWMEIGGRPEKRAKNSILSKKRWQDPEYREKIHTEEAKAKRSAKGKANWDNPEYRAKRTALLGSKEVCDRRLQSRLETQSKEGYINTWWKEIVAVDSNNKICMEFKMVKEASDWVLEQTGRVGAIRYYIQNNHRNFNGYKWLYKKDYKE